MVRVQKVREYISETSPVNCDKKKYLKKIRDKLVISERNFTGSLFITIVCI